MRAIAGEQEDGPATGSRTARAGERAGETVSIDCSTCCARGTAACDDCLVTAVLSRPAGSVHLDGDEQEAVRRLQQAGLVPLVRYRPAS